MNMQLQTLRIFCGYAQEDKEFFHQLKQALAIPMRREKNPAGQRCRLSSSGAALFEGSEQGRALVTKTKARELLALSDGGLLAQFAKACTVKPGGALFQVLAMGRILLPPGRVGHTAPVAQQIGIPVLATTHAAILRLEPANAALHVVVGAGKVLPVVALHQVRSQVGEHV